MLDGSMGSLIANSSSIASRFLRMNNTKPISDKPKKANKLTSIHILNFPSFHIFMATLYHKKMNLSMPKKSKPKFTSVFCLMFNLFLDCRAVKK